MANTARQPGKSARKTVGRPFTKGTDSRRGRGPEKGAPNAGRPPEWLKEQMRVCRETAVEQISELLESKGLDVDQRIKVVEKFKDDTHGPGVGVWFFQLLPAQSLEEWAKGQPGILGK